MKKFNFSVDLINDNILKSLLIFSIPILVSNIFQQLYNMADIAIVGHTLGDNSLAAIGASAAIFELIFGFALGIGNGLSMVTARNYGANNKNLLKKSVAGSIVIGIWITVGVMILSRFILMPLLKILHTPENIIKEAFEYINIITMFIGVTFSYNLSSGLLRAIGNSFMSLVFLVIASILNIFLDIYFITSLKMGIGGAAIATVIAQAISVILSIIYIYVKEPILIPRKKHFRFDKKLYKELLGQGLSMGFMIAIVLMGTLILQYAINGFGYLIIAGHTSARKLMGFCNIPLTTIALALATFVSQNKGANKVDRIRKGVFYANMMDIIFAIGITVFVYLFSKNMIHLMSGSESEIVLHNGSTYLKIASPFFTILGILFNLRYALQALGEKLIPLVSSVIEFFGKIIFVIFIVPKLGYLGVMICEPLIWIVMVGQLGIAFYGNGYVKKSNNIKF
ncbi:MATE efflux family protein [Leptotrichia trevisanii]|uniref:MATE family efflux transporter n=1 Tax=Leptotrichia trevisanii TaxID=109328 RepID=UPI00118D2856|nr:MATE family efflux transporter [Leptotrichia trevisanii]BBM58386.1 MATE efflux family protein [Leptotrichia trevisanii]